MTTTTVATALDRIARLTPVRAAGASRLTGESAAVCTPWQTVPPMFQQAQRDRTAYYLTTRRGHGRVPTGELAERAPRYIVTSYGVPIAWVTMDGRTHYVDDAALTAGADGTVNGRSPRRAAMARHRDAIRAAWPARFALDSMGDPMFSRDGAILPAATDAPGTLPAALLV